MRLKAKQNCSCETPSNLLAIFRTLENLWLGRFDAVIYS